IDPVHQNYYIKDSIAYTEDHVPVRMLFFCNFPKDLIPSLDDHFGMYGKIVRLHIFNPKKNHRIKRRLVTGYVFFENAKDAAQALQCRTHHVNGRKFHVNASDSWNQPDAYGAPELPNGEEVPPMPPIFSLNDHCLAYILEYLPLPDQMRFARSCLRFTAVYQEASPRLNKVLDLSKFDDMTVWEMRDFFRLSGPHVHSVQGIVPATRLHRLCDFMGANCSNVKVVQLFRSPLDPRNLEKMLANMHTLETLQLPMSDLTDAALLSLRLLVNLKKLNLDGNPLKGHALQNFNCPVEILSLNDCAHLEPINLVRICRNFSHLRELSIKNIHTKVLPAFQILVKINGCPALEILRMTAFGNVKYEFVAQFPSLRQLTIYTVLVGRRTLRNKLFEQLVVHKSQQLEQLEIYGATQLSRTMMTHIGQLQGLQYILLPRIEVDSALNELASLHHLERIIMRHSGNITGSSVLKLFRACPKLSEIRLDECIDSCESLVLGIVSRVRQEIANKEIQRQLPVKLHILIQLELQKLVEDREAVPRGIIEVTSTSNW
ncbi:hypothetical protein KR009_003683, partial [Drosophila setifemur]